MTAITLTKQNFWKNIQKVYELLEKNPNTKIIAEEEISFAEYVTSGAIKKDKRSGPFAPEQLLQHLDSLKSAWK